MVVRINDRPTEEIPLFPSFTPLQFGHGHAIEDIVAQYDPYADFTFVNLYTWSIKDKTEVSLLNDNLVVKFPDYLSGKDTYSIIGDKKIDESVRVLMELSGELHLVPEIVVNELAKTDDYIITEDYGGHDYVYDLSRLSGLNGKSLKNKRNKLNRFVNDYGQKITATTLENVKLSEAHEVKQVFREWAIANHKTQEEFSAEEEAIDRLLAHFDKLGLLLTVVRIEGVMCAFSVNEILPNGYAICHFEKATKTYEGAYTYVINVAARDLLARGAKQVNWEQDLGLPGLRKAKSSYKPAWFLKKYSIESK